MDSLDETLLAESRPLINDFLYARIADDIERQGCSICPAVLPTHISDALRSHQLNLNAANYSAAGIGRGQGYITNESIRTDDICWIDEASIAGSAWLDWTAGLQRFLNRRLFLGLFSFESHFAHYSPGDYYKRHYDAFRGDANRILSIITYLNPVWDQADRGELVIYRDDADQEGIKVLPNYGTIVVFLSGEFPHEVLPAEKDRYSVAGWFRLNGSNVNKVDPPG